MAINEFPIGQTLLGISTIEDQEFSGDELYLDEIKLYFEDLEQKITLVTLSPIVDTDEIDVKIEKTTNLYAAASLGNNQLVYSLVLGAKLMNIWVCENEQGYQDQVIFAFGSLHPSIAFIAEGSVIKAFINKQILKDKRRNEELQEAQSRVFTEMILAQIKQNPSLINFFTGVPQDENSFEKEKIETVMENQQLHEIKANPDNNVVISAHIYQKLINRIKELENIVNIQADMK